MKRKMKKKLIAFMLCMVLVICNSVSILADAPAAATTTAENQVSETKTAKNETTSGDNKSSDDNSADKDKDTSSQSDDPEKEESDKEEALETKTTEQKEETTEATTEEKEDSTTATTEAEEGTTETTTEDKATTEAADETSESDEKKETTKAENSSETSGTTEETTEAKEETAASELTFTNDDVVITVSEVAEGAIPEGAELKVVPILKDDANTQEQYAEVEEQIKNKGLETETQIKGFLAYDITLINKDNNEIEPSGEVQVSISYKDSVLPDSLSEEKVQDMDVTVMHLEENDMGQVEKVVDMSENSQIKNMQTTESNAIEKAEFVTESFSVFTISWIDGPRLTAYCVDSNGNKIPVNDGGSEMTIRNISINREVKVSELSTKLDGYTFANAYVTRRDINSSDDFESEDIIQRIRYNGDSWQYSKRSTGDNNWNDINGNTKLYFKYESFNGDISKKTTVNSSELGIDINLYNYNSNINETELEKEEFFFHDNNGSLDGRKARPGSNTQYKYTNSNGLQQGYVKFNLSNDGYPELKNDKLSLAELFRNSGTGITGSYLHLDGLFYQDENGYYVYDSEFNHAQLNTETNRIDVYNATLSPDKTYNNDNFKKGNFLPFNQFPQAATTEGQLYSVSGGREKTDLWFGMNINTSFYQPKDGKVNGEKMVFEFSGDDDVWVFIDDVLVLDIGGIHGAIDGSINFQEGTVVVDGKKTTLAQQFEEAYREQGFNDNQITSQLDNMFNKVDGEYTSFKNFSSHDMKFFYLERGGGASNCKIKFNMPVLPEDSIRIGKEISNYDKGAYNDVQFQFKLYTGTGTDKDSFNLVSEGEEYTLIKANGERSTEYVGENGIFTLKHGEQAQFDKLGLDTNYYVKEIGLSSETYDKVTIESVEVVNEDNQNVGGKTEIESKILNVGENHIVNFKNRCAVTNMKYLIIEKTLEGSSDSNQDESFTFKVTVGGGLYKGNYKIGNSYNTAVASNQELSTDDGTITLTAGEVAVILGNATSGDKRGIPSGTSFKVEEINLDKNIYRIPSYTMKEKDEDGESLIDNPVISDDTYDGYAAGKITLNDNAEVNVTNAYSKQYTIKVDKTWAYPEEFSLDSTTTKHSEVMVALYDGDTIAENANGEKLVQTTDNGMCTFTNLPENTYTVREVVKSEDQYIPIESGGYVKLGEDDKVNNVTGNIYSVSYGEKTTGLPEDVDKYYTVTNTLVLGSVEITKTDAENKPLADAEFTITGPNNYSNVAITELKTTEDDEKIATVKFTNLLPGEYTITETKSPAGHSLLANPIKIKIGAGEHELNLNGTLNQDEGYNAIASSTGKNSTYYYNWGATVVNNKLFTMPEAGGRNIFMMTLAGTAMIALAAGSTIYYRRRRSAHSKTRR